MPELLEQVRDEMRTRHYSYCTEQTYLHWIKRFILFHGKRHPSLLDAIDISSFLTYLAVHPYRSSLNPEPGACSFALLYRDITGS